MLCNHGCEIPKRCKGIFRLLVLAGAVGGSSVSPLHEDPACSISRVSLWLAFFGFFLNPSGCGNLFLFTRLPPRFHLLIDFSSFRKGGGGVRCWGVKNIYTAAFASGWCSLIRVAFCFHSEMGNVSGGARTHNAPPWPYRVTADSSHLFVRCCCFFREKLHLFFVRTLGQIVMAC